MTATIFSVTVADKFNKSYSDFSAFSAEMSKSQRTLEEPMPVAR
jgi:hypothetical protein